MRVCLKGISSKRNVSDLSFCPVCLSVNVRLWLSVNLFFSLCIFICRSVLSLSPCQAFKLFFLSLIIRIFFSLSVTPYKLLPFCIFWIKCPFYPYFIHDPCFSICTFSLSISSHYLYVFQSFLSVCYIAYVYVYIYLFLFSVHLFFSLSVSASLCSSLYVYLFLSLSVCLFITIHVNISLFSLFVCQSLNQFPLSDVFLSFCSPYLHVYMCKYIYLEINNSTRNECFHHIHIQTVIRYFKSFGFPHLPMHE